MDRFVKEVRICVNNNDDLDQSQIEFAGKLWGKENGEPWLLLHGWLDNASSFDVLVPLLCEKMPNAQFLCYDFAGHGHSNHRYNGVYHFIDYVADAYTIVEAMGWKSFNIIGHSLGQGIASILAGSIPDRVKNLVLIEGIGPHTDLPEDVPKGFERSLNKLNAPQKDKKIYTSRKEATDRRVQGNAVGPLAESAATILVARGTKPVKISNNDTGIKKSKLISKNGSFSVWEVEQDENEDQDQSNSEDVSWTFDEGVKTPSRVRLSEPIVQSFFKRIKCPTLLILANDGILSRGRVKPSTFTSTVGRLLIYFFFYLFLILSKIPFIGRRFVPIFKKLNLAASYCSRISNISNLRSLIIPSGGHHPHLMEKEAIFIVDGIVKMVNSKS